MAPKVVRLSAEEITLLRDRFEKLNEVTSFKVDTALASKIAAYGIFREVGTVNDELARFIFDAETSQPVRLKSLKAEFVEWNGLWGLRIFSSDTQCLELRTKGFYEIVHPGLSANEDGTLHSIFLFPQIIFEIAKAQGVDLVLVKSWGLNSIFGGFDPTQGYYQTNFWELENNDALKFADLVRSGQLAFMGTHDLLAHIAGVESWQWSLLKETSEKVYQVLSAYFSSVTRPGIAALILPYTIGVVLDDLAQPPTYGSKNHLAVLDELLLTLTKNEIPANLQSLLTQFPEGFQKIIELSRTVGVENKPLIIKSAIAQLVGQIFNPYAGRYP